MYDDGYLEEVVKEFDGIDLADRRREARAKLMLARFALQPGRGIPSTMVDPAESEAAYRLLRNPLVDPDDILEPHLERSAARVRDAALALVFHDTSEFKFAGEAQREGLGPMHGTNDQGFVGHFSLAAEAEAEGHALGVLAVTTYAREVKKASAPKGKRNGWSYSKQSVKESGRWEEHIDQVATRCGPDVELVHVADSEADSYELMLFCIEKKHRFVFRMARDRCARVDESAELETVRTIAAQANDELEIEVPLTARKPSKIPGMRAARESRKAKLRFAATTLQIKRPSYLFGQTEWIEVNVVHVHEVDCPAGLEPVDWMLFTSEPVASRADVCRVVDFYRRRWLIEEFFKALKTGCAMEKRELETFDSLTRALSFFVPIAFHMLRLRSATKAAATDEPAVAALTPTQVEVLVATKRLKPNASAREAFLAVATLGGYYNKQRPPGWRVLAQGMHTLVLYEQAFIIARATDHDPIKR